MNKRRPCKVFISYKSEEHEWVTKLKNVLRLYVRQGLIETWDDDQIRPGTKWKEEIAKHIASSDAIILMISLEFFSSDFIYEKEFLEALRQAEERGVKLWAIAVTHSLYEETELRNIQFVNDPKEPLKFIDANGDIESEWVKIAKKLKAELDQLGCTTE